MGYNDCKLRHQTDPDSTLDNSSLVCNYESDLLSIKIIERGIFKGYRDTRRFNCYSKHCRVTDDTSKVCAYCKYLPYFSSPLKFVRATRKARDKEDENNNNNNNNSSSSSNNNKNSYKYSNKNSNKNSHNSKCTTDGAKHSKCYNKGSESGATVVEKITQDQKLANVQSVKRYHYTNEIHFTGQYKNSVNDEGKLVNRQILRNSSLTCESFCSDSKTKGTTNHVENNDYHETNHFDTQLKSFTFKKHGHLYHEFGDLHSRNHRVLERNITWDELFETLSQLIGHDWEEEIEGEEKVNEVNVAKKNGDELTMPRNEPLLRTNSDFDDAIDGEQQGKDDDYNNDDDDELSQLDDRYFENYNYNEKY
ncbi:predicted protein [Lodderomyces elongisporus NRRL YB-4239]|uniref:Uncharacterized protein n=1 Tax=Lodderomyces elongisporus (strain ATCC 11503 / CBS 2605 / JCM 1781 / NBRC 1676 / NRRL YB-4239) TaxID=379508 RepID=A5E661_LODEL|nr:predicted protein [Lodderomyces elongisporus NRRL YB-4239]